MEYLPGDSGDSDPDIANPTVDGHLDANVDMILGRRLLGHLPNVIDKITGVQDPLLAGQHVQGAQHLRRRRPVLPYGAVRHPAGPRKLADLMIEEGVTTAAILARQDSYGEGLLEDTKGPAEDQGRRSC